MLESLSLEVTRRKKFAGCYIFNIPTVKRLKLTFALVITSDINKVVLRVPNLEYLFLGGVLCSLFQMEDVSSLVEVSVSLRHIAYDYLWVELLNGVSGVKSLLTQDIPSSFLLPIFPNMNRLELGKFWHYRQILQFVEGCPALKHLYIEKVLKLFFFFFVLDNFFYTYIILGFVYLVCVKNKSLENLTGLNRRWFLRVC
ncbi:putative leucine-rich repeat domain superfamily [Helianthus debilis subsp. tardiflorus]